MVWYSAEEGSEHGRLEIFPGRGLEVLVRRRGLIARREDLGLPRVGVAGLVPAGRALAERLEDGDGRYQPALPRLEVGEVDGALARRRAGRRGPLQAQPGLGQIASSQGRLAGEVADPGPRRGVGRGPSALGGRGPSALGELEGALDRGPRLALEQEEALGVAEGVEGILGLELAGGREALQGPLALALLGENKAEQVMAARVLATPLDEPPQELLRLLPASGAEQGLGADRLDLLAPALSDVSLRRARARSSSASWEEKSLAAAR